MCVCDAHPLLGLKVGPYAPLVRPDLVIAEGAVRVGASPLGRVAAVHERDHIDVLVLLLLCVCLCVGRLVGVCEVVWLRACVCVMRTPSLDSK